MTSADGTETGLLTAGDGPPLLLVRGGMGCIESWAPMWGALLIPGSASPAWAHEIIHDLDAVLRHKTLAVLDGQGHDAIDRAPELLMTQLAGFFS